MSFKTRHRERRISLICLLLLASACRSLSHQEPSVFREGEAENYEVKNTFLGGAGLEVTQGELQEIHSIGLANNHTYPLKDLEKADKEARMKPIFIKKGGKTVAYMLLQESQKAGAKVILVHDAALHTDHLSDEKAIELLNEELSKMATRENALPFIMIKNNKYVYQVELVEKKLKFLDVNVAGATTPARDENTQVFVVGKHYYVRGDVPKKFLEDLKDNLGSTSVFDEERIEAVFDPESLAVLIDAGFEDLKRKRGSQKEVIELDAVGQERENKLVQALLRPQPKSIALTGKAGIGKTYQSQRIFTRLAQGDLDKRLPPGFLDRALIFILDMDKFNAGTHYRGSAERRSSAVKKIVAQPLHQGGGRLLILGDEMHDAARPTAGGEPNFLPKIKPELATGRVFFYGQTTEAEYKKYVAADAALDSRFQKDVFPDASYDNLIKIVEIKTKDVPLQGMTRNEFACLFYDTYATLQPGGTIRWLEDFAFALVAKVRDEKVEGVSREYFLKFTRERYNLPDNFEFPSLDVVAKSRQQAKEAANSRYPGQVDDPSLQAIDRAVVGAFSDQRGQRINIIKGEVGSGRTYMAETVAEALGRNHVSIKLSAASTMDSVRRDIMSKVMEPVGVGNALAVVSFENFDQASPAVQMQLLDLIREGKFEEFRPDGYHQYDISATVVFIETNDDAIVKANAETNTIDLKPRGREGYVKLVSQAIGEEIAQNRLLAGIKPEPAVLDELAKVFLEKHKWIGEKTENAPTAGQIREKVSGFLIEHFSQLCNQVFAGRPEAATGQ